MKLSAVCCLTLFSTEAFSQYGGPPPFPKIELLNYGTLHHNDVVHVCGTTSGVPYGATIHYCVGNSWYNNGSYGNYSVNYTTPDVGGSFSSGQGYNMFATGSYSMSAMYQSLNSSYSGSVQP